ncbi:MAG: hypothetical protein DRG31_00325 [Deltaproteobacteria bacterium]|nr:MAG: hypothetical protein DRG31_00325 [Deltaproteobacteria bacterium]
MRRYDLRCSVEIPVTIVPSSEEIKPYETYTKDLGLYGVFLKSNQPISEGTWAKLIMKLPRGSFETKGTVLRKEASGIAIRFKKPDAETKARIWDIIRNRIPSNFCPFCGAINLNGATHCQYCGSILDFHSSSFLQLYEKQIYDVKFKELFSTISIFKEKCRELEESLEFHSQEEMVSELGHYIYKIAHICREIEDLGICDEQSLQTLKKKVMEETEEVFQKSYLINYARKWPKGYPGDYRMLELVYRNTPVSTGIGRILDIIFLRATLAKAVRGRLKLLTEILRNEFMDRKSPKVLNIACGSSRELMDLVKEISASQAQITCIDFDEEALDFSSQRLAFTPIRDNVIFRKYNAVRMVNHKRVLTDFGPQDVIYSTGLFDYLTDDLLVKLLNSLYNLLNPGGKLILAFKDANRYDTGVYHWIVNWSAFFQRTPYDISMLFEKAMIPRQNVLTMREPSGVIIFYVVERT